jgi:hypothetical protein
MSSSIQWVGPFNSGAAAGGAGVATANASSNHKLCGKVHAIYVKYNDSPPAGTTDILIATVGTSPAVPAITLLSIANAATDTLKYPRAQVHGTDGSALTLDGTRIAFDKIAIDDVVNVKIDQANNGDSIDVWLALEHN